MIMRRIARLGVLAGFVILSATAPPPARAEAAETDLACQTFCALTFGVCVAATMSPSCVAYYYGCVQGCSL